MLCTVSRHHEPENGKQDLVKLLQESILLLTQKFDSFNDTVTDKITAIERNYEELNAKVDNLQRPGPPAEQTFGVDNKKCDTNQVSG